MTMAKKYFVPWRVANRAENVFAGDSVSKETGVYRNLQSKAEILNWRLNRGFMEC